MVAAARARRHAIKHERQLREQWQQDHMEIHRLEQRALNISATDLSRRLEGMNEFRAQLVREREGYVQRDLYDREHATTAERQRVDSERLDNRVRDLERRSNIGQGGAHVWAIVGSAALAAIALIFNLLELFGIVGRHGV